MKYESLLLDKKYYDLFFMLAPTEECILQIKERGIIIYKENYKLKI
jgi:hypothetical protein